MKVVVLHEEVAANPRPDELDVLTQARFVVEQLTALGHAATTLAFGLRVDAFIDSITREKPDCVFNIVESVAGHGRLISLAPSVLESLRIPFTGAGADAMYVTSNKLLGKTILRGAGLPTADWLTEVSHGAQAREVWHRFPTRPGESPTETGDSATGFQPVETFKPGRYIIKSVWEHASVGLGDDAVMHFDTLADLQGEIARRAPALGGQAFAEPYIHGREFNIALLTRGPGQPPQVLPHAEILFEGYAANRPHIVDYRAKWDEASYEYNHTPRRFDFPASDQPLLSQLTDLCLKCWDVVRLRGYARVDFRVDDTGHPFILEINANPCLSPDAGFAAALLQAGISPVEAISQILSDR